MLKNKENKRFVKYFLIGIYTTFITFLLWNFLLALTKFLPIGFEKRFSVTQYLASFLMIFPSFWLHRQITFKDKTIRSNFGYTTTKVYIIYIIAPLVASVFTYFCLLWFPYVVNFSVKFNLFLEYDLPLGKYFLQATSLAIGMLTNYSGQRFWVYK